MTRLFGQLLHYTSLNTSPCSEHIHVPQGHTCISDKTVELLEENKDKLLKNTNYKNNILLSGSENIPTDGSSESITIRDYLTGLNLNNEYQLLTHKKIKDFLGKKIVKAELERLKPSGDRFIIRGTLQHEVYEVLRNWTKVFKFFHPIEEHDKTINGIFRIIKSTYPEKKVYGMFIHLSEDDGCHAVSILIDMRYNQWSIEYFDSEGDPPNYINTKLMMGIKQKLLSFSNGKFDITVITANGRRIHQQTDAECGILSLIYIRRRLEGVPITAFRNYSVASNFALDFRRFIFSN